MNLVHKVDLDVTTGKVIDAKKYINNIQTL